MSPLDQEKVARMMRDVIWESPCEEKTWQAIRGLWARRFANIDSELDNLGFEIVKKEDVK